MAQWYDRHVSIGGPCSPPSVPASGRALNTYSLSGSAAGSSPSPSPNCRAWATRWALVLSACAAACESAGRQAADKRAGGVASAMLPPDPSVQADVRAHSEPQCSVGGRSSHSRCSHHRQTLCARCKCDACVFMRRPERRRALVLSGSDGRSRETQAALLTGGAPSLAGACMQRAAAAACQNARLNCDSPPTRTAVSPPHTPPVRRIGTGPVAFGVSILVRKATSCVRPPSAVPDAGVSLASGCGPGAPVHHLRRRSHHQHPAGQRLLAPLRASLP